MGTLQATEALKIALGEPPLSGLLIHSSKAREWKSYTFEKNPNCPDCSKESAYTSKKTPVEESDTLHITPKELAPLLANSEIQLIDVREPFEADICRIEGSRLIPMESLSERMGTLERTKKIVTYCHTGNRSLFAARTLKENGFHARSLDGGISRWADEIEPDMKRY